MSRHPGDQITTTLTTTIQTVDRSDSMPSATVPEPVPNNASPFLLRIHDVETLSHSDGFTILREHLAEHYSYDLCDNHTPAHLENQERWLIVRDVLHALLVPVVELFDKASTVASQATKASKLEDLEYAFTGQARSAFIWMQCFLSSEKERDWCYTRGCPACVVDHSLDSEFSIRLLYAACLLSDVHYPFTLEGPTLPSFMFFLDSLERAIEQDQLYGADFFELMQPKAVATRNGIEELIHQCLELDALISLPPSPADSEPTTPELAPSIGPLGGTPGMKVKRSKMARRQMKLKVEEEAWMEEMLKKMTGEVEAMSIAAQELDVAGKVAKATVTVAEVEVDK